MDPITLAALLSAGGSILGGLLGSSAADKAAKTQTDASNRAIDLQAATIAQARLDSAPWLEAGRQALQAYMGELGFEGFTLPAMGAPTTPTTPTTPATPTTPPANSGANSGRYRRGNTLSKPTTPTTPTTTPTTPTTPATTTPSATYKGFQATPGYQFMVDEAESGAMNHLGALGMKNSGAALKALTKLRSGLANQEYGNYLNRLAGMAGAGQTQVNTTNALTANSALNQGALMQDAGASRASGYVGGANSWIGALNGVGNTLGNWAGQQPRVA